MADIFISYKRENLAAVQRLVQGLRGAGLSVWWDQDITPDAAWEATIERELETAKVTIVAWSEAAAASENVKAEARRARDRGKLIQVFIEPCAPPLFFGERQGVDLSSWHGDAGDHRFKTITAAARAILAGRKPPQGVGYTPKKRAPWATLTSLLVLVGAALGLLANLEGARAGLCLIGIRQACATPGPSAEALEARQDRLLQGLNGAWGRLDRDCTATVTYRVEASEPGVWRIRARAPGFESTMQVAAVDAATRVITARSAAPNESGVRELWEFRREGDVLSLRDPAGTETVLSRCEM